MKRYNLRKKYVLIIAIIIIGILVYYLNISHINNSVQVLKDEYKNEFITKTGRIEKQLVGKEIKSLKHIIRKYNSYNIVLLYSGINCGNCNKKAFGLIKAIDSLSNRNLTTVVAYNSDTSYDSIIFDYKNFIFLDEKQSIRKELNYILTPVLLLIDKNSKIYSVYFPSLYTDHADDEKFLNLVKKQLSDI